MQKCVFPSTTLILKPALRADLRMSAEGPPLTTTVARGAELLAVFGASDFFDCSETADVAAVVAALAGGLDWSD